MLEPQARRGHHGRQGLRPRPCRRIPVYRRRAQPGVDQPHRQRRRRRWTATGTLTIRDRRATTTGRWSRSPTPARASPRTSRPDLRAVLHHQARRRGHRARARHLVADRRRQAPRRPVRRPREPGDTRFQVRLPIRPPTRQDATQPVMTAVTIPASTRPCRRAAPAASSATRRDGWWFHLRRCAQCGHIGCCDTSPSQHATAHAAETGHPVMRDVRAAARTGSGTTRPTTTTTGRLAPPEHRPRRADARPGRAGPRELAPPAALTPAVRRRAPRRRRSRVAAPPFTGPPLPVRRLPS